MGNFIEDLRREMAAREEAQRIANQLADQRDGKERATKIIEENLRKTKEQVEQESFRGGFRKSI